MTQRNRPESKRAKSLRVQRQAYDHFDEGSAKAIEDYVKNMSESDKRAIAVEQHYSSPDHPLEEEDKPK